MLFAIKTYSEGRRSAEAVPQQGQRREAVRTETMPIMASRPFLISDRRCRSSFFASIFEVRPRGAARV